MFVHCMILFSAARLAGLNEPRTYVALSNPDGDQGGKRDQSSILNGFVVTLHEKHVRHAPRPLPANLVLQASNSVIILHLR